MSKKLENISLDAIKASVKTQVREAINEEALASYTEAAKAAKEKGADSPFPPLVIFRDKETNTDWLGDGFHRRKALKAAGFEATEVEVKEGNEQDAFLYGVKANAEHGVRLTTADYVGILNTILDFPGNESLPNTDLAKLIGKSEFFVRKNRPAAKDDKSKRVVSKNGKKQKVDASAIGAGKGTGKKAAKKAAKATKKAPKKGNATPDADAAGKSKEKQDDKTDKSINRIVAAIDGKGFDGAKFREGVKSGAITVSAADLRVWSESSDARILAAAPLVLNQKWTPRQAYAFLDVVVSTKTRIEHLVNATVSAQGKAVLENLEDVAGFKVLIIPDTYEITRNYQEGTFNVAPKKAAK